MILTLPYLEDEANDIVGYWNGSDDRFVDGSGTVRTEDDVQIAEDIIKLCKELKDLYALIN